MHHRFQKTLTEPVLKSAKETLYSSWYDASIGFVAQHGVGFPGVGDPIGKDQGIVTVKEVL